MTVYLSLCLSVRPRSLGLRPQYLHLGRPLSPLVPDVVAGYLASSDAITHGVLAHPPQTEVIFSVGAQPEKHMTSRPAELLYAWVAERPVLCSNVETTLTHAGVSQILVGFRRAGRRSATRTSIVRVKPTCNPDT